MGRELETTPEVRREPQEKVAILDAGAQYGKVIDRRIRNLQTYSDILPLDTPAEDLNRYDAIVISGGPESVYADGAPHCDPHIFELDKPILGICYGMQLINQAFGGAVEKHERREDGPCRIEVTTSSPLFEGLGEEQDVLMSHGDSISNVAPGFEVIAHSNGIIAGIADPQRRIYGLQFHPEVDLTNNGTTMLHNFLSGVAQLEGIYTLEDREAEAVRYIQETVGQRDVLVFVSGGVDSTVCATLLPKAISPEKIHAVHVDTGLMRLNESAGVEIALRQAGIDLKLVYAEERFLNATTYINGEETLPLHQVVDPEIKRAIVGDTFMKVLEQTLQDLQLDPHETVLAQGTLRPDLIESASRLASSSAAVIKTHHNDTTLVRELREIGRVVEPLNGLHKDEVRELGERLGLPPEIVWRQPFPGPGLAIRVICAEKPFITDDFKEVRQALQEFNTSDISTSLLPIRTVGVQGDGRSYSYLVGLTGKPKWPELMQMAGEIPKAVHKVNRVAYVFGEQITEPVQEITPTYLTHEVLEQLRAADDIVNQTMLRYELMRVLKQVPVVSFPVHFGKPGNHSIAIRTFITNDWMTGIPATPGVHYPEAALREMVEGILDIPGISRVAYDLTSKPPGTTEWE